MPLSPEQLAAKNRLLNYYDGDAPYDPTTNPGGFRRGGNVPNFEPALKDVAVGIEGAAVLVGDAQAAAGAAESVKNQAQNAVATGRITRDTLPASSEWQTYADGAQLEVLSGSGAGLYVKTGAVGGGSLTLKSKATVTALDTRTSTIETGNPTVFDADLAVVIADESGNVLGGFDHANRLVAELAAPDVVELHDPNYSFVIPDPQGNPLLAADHDNRIILDLATPPYFAYLKGAEGGRRLSLWSEAGGEIDLSTGEFDDVLSGRAGLAWASYLGRNAGGNPVRREAYLLPKTSLSAGVTSLVGLIIHGQSLAVGAAAGAPISTAALNPGRAASFNGGVRVHGREHDDPTLLVDPANLRDFVDLVERRDGTSGETVASQAAATFLARAPASTGLVAAAVGVGSQAYANLKKGTAPYANLVATALRMVQVARLTGRAMPRIVVFWRQGESNLGDGEAGYTANLLELQADVSAIIKRITGQTVEVVLITDQISVAPNLETAGAARAQLSAVLANPTRLASLGPKYVFGYSDGLHLTSLGQAWSGAYLGRFLGRLLLDGVSPLPLYVASASRSGATVTLTMAGGSGTALVRDTTLVSNPGDTQPYGVLWRDAGNGNSVTVSDVTVSGMDTVTVTLSAAPTGTNGRLLIAGYTAATGSNGGPTTGPRSCIRDSASETVTISGQSYPLYNWASHQVVPVA